MTTLDKLEKLNEWCRGSLSINHYRMWEIHSYKDDTPLSKKRFVEGSFEVLIDKAYEYVSEKNI